MEEIQKPQFFAYCRESIDLKTGIGIQKELIKNFCDAYGITIKKWFIDNDYSAYKFRPDFDKMWKLLDDCDGIISKDMTRFGRHDADLLYRFNELKERGKRLILINDNIDTNNESNELLMKILAIFAHREGVNIKERLAAGRAYAKIHGTKSGKPMHRPSKTINWKMYDELTEKGLKIPSIALVLGVSKSKMYKAVNERKVKNERKGWD